MGEKVRKEREAINTLKKILLEHYCGDVPSSECYMDCYSCKMRRVKRILQEVDKK